LVVNLQWMRRGISPKNLDHKGLKTGAERGEKGEQANI